MRMHLEKPNWNEGLFRCIVFLASNEQALSQHYSSSRYRVDQSAFQPSA